MAHRCTSPDMKTSQDDTKIYPYPHCSKEQSKEHPSADVEGAGSKRPKEVERHARRKQENKYNHRDPETRERLICDLCPPGTHWVEHCTKQQTTKCQICPENHYTAVHNKAKECVYCNEFCTKPNQRAAEGCTKTQNRRCECLPGHYLNRELCSPHKSCPPGKGVARTGTPEKNTRCRKCERGYFSAVRSSTAPCRQHRDCSLQKLRIVDSGNRFRDNICGDMEEPTHPPVVSVLNVTYDAEMPHTVDLLLSATLPKPGSHPSSSTFIQSLKNVSQSPDEQLVRATTAIQLSSDQLTSDSSTLAELVPVAEEEEPCNSTVVPFMAYSVDAGNFTAIVDQSTRNDSIREVDDIEDFQTGSQLVDLPMPMPSHYYTGESQENSAVENPAEESMLPEFADSVMANITEGPTDPPSLETVAEIPSLHGAPDQHYENQIIQEERMELTTVTINSSQHPPKPPTKMDGTDTPALDVAEVVNAKDMGQGDKDLWIVVAMSLLAAMLAFSSVTCVFVVVHPICRSQVYGAILQLWPRTTSGTDEPPRYADNNNENTNVAEDNVSVTTGSDDTQSVVVDIDDVTDPKACAGRPLSVASSIESVRDAFRDAQVYISEHIGINWRSLSNHLPGKRLTEVQLDCIEDENRRVVERAMKMLVQWKELNGSRANVERMAKGLDACGQKKIACKVREMGL
ncbi:hypothetical protein Bbelb_220840 [Branchiostoma belcheri]|nr:hypothetical protein Bbelb_220840 [Branchiostoma belcheri]